MTQFTLAISYRTYVQKVPVLLEGVVLHYLFSVAPLPYFGGIATSPLDVVQEEITSITRLVKTLDLGEVIFKNNTRYAQAYGAMSF